MAVPHTPGKGLKFVEGAQLDTGEKANTGPMDPICRDEGARTQALRVFGEQANYPSNGFLRKVWQCNHLGVGGGVEDDGESNARR